MDMAIEGRIKWFMLDCAVRQVMKESILDLNEKNKDLVNKIEKIFG